MGVGVDVGVGVGVGVSMSMSMSMSMGMVGLQGHVGIYVGIYVGGGRDGADRFPSWPATPGDPPHSPST